MENMEIRHEIKQPPEMRLNYKNARNAFEAVSQKAKKMIEEIMGATEINDDFAHLECLAGKGLTFKLDKGLMVSVGYLDNNRELYLTDPDNGKIINWDSISEEQKENIYRMVSVDVYKEFRGDNESKEE